jgi:hypothetical protein
MASQAIVTCGEDASATSRLERFERSCLFSTYFTLARRCPARFLVSSANPAPLQRGPCSADARDTVRFRWRKTGGSLMARSPRRRFGRDHPAGGPQGCSRLGGRCSPLVLDVRIGYQHRPWCPTTSRTKLATILSRAAGSGSPGRFTATIMCRRFGSSTKMVMLSCYQALPFVSFARSRFRGLGVRHSSCNNAVGRRARDLIEPTHAVKPADRLGVSQQREPRQRCDSKG